MFTDDHARPPRRHGARWHRTIPALTGLLVAGAAATPVSPAIARPATARGAAHARGIPFRTKNPSAYATQKRQAAAAYERFERQKAARATPAPHTVISGDLNQAGLSASDSGGGTPPDTTGAIGPSNYIEMVNSEIAVYSRSSLASPTAQAAD